MDGKIHCCLILVGKVNKNSENRLIPNAIISVEQQKHGSYCLFCKNKQAKAGKKHSNLCFFAMERQEQKETDNEHCFYR